MKINSTYNSFLGQTQASAKDVDTTTQANAQGEAKDATTKEQVAATYEESSEVKQATYEKPKKLTAEQIDALKQSQEDAKLEMLRQMVDATVQNQGGTATRAGLANKSGDKLLIEIFGSLEAALPPVATTPEGAAEAIAPGGAYSVDGVTDRLMKMAKAIAGDDPKKLEQMEKAVQEGFKMAGMDLETGKGLPEICYDTYKATMDAFSTWREELGVA